MTLENFTLGTGEHACLFYEDFNDQKRVALPFIREGLLRKEQCVYVANEQADDEWCEELQAYGIDVARELRERNLIVCKGEHWRHSGKLSSITKAKQAWGMIEDALENHGGIRFVVDMGWTLDSEMTSDNLCHWEATQNPLIAGDQEIRILCQYNILRHPAESLHAALRTHPITIAQGVGGPNPFYEAPRILENEPYFNRCVADPSSVADMLAQLSFAAAK
jgi:hypothetical protein